MRTSRLLCTIALWIAPAAWASGSQTGNPSAPYCRGGSTVGSTNSSGSGGGSPSGNLCTPGSATTSFGANYLDNQLTGTATTQCSAGDANVPAMHLLGSSNATAVLQPATTDDDKFLLKAGETPAAIIEVDTSDALMDFSRMPDVPGTFPVGSGWRTGHPMGCPSPSLEAKLHRGWKAFGNSYYYGDPTDDYQSDPDNFKYFACWQPITLGKDQVYQYRNWGSTNTPENLCKRNFGDRTLDYYQCLYCLYDKDTVGTVPDPATWQPDDGVNTGGSGTCSGTTVPSGSGYYIVSNARSSNNKSLFASRVVIDYPPMWIPLYWASKFMINNGMTDLSGKTLFPVRREVRTINNSMPATACSSATMVAGNGMHPTCSRSNPYSGDHSYSAGFNALDKTFGDFTSSTPAIGTDLPLAAAIKDAAAAYVAGGLNPTGNGEGWCSTCASNHVIVLSAGETCHDEGSTNLVNWYDATATCSGDCAYTTSTCTPRGGGAATTCGGSANVWPNQVAKKIGSDTTDLLSAVPGNQKLTVDGIGIGQHNLALTAATLASGGTYVDASDDPGKIHDALFNVLGDLIHASVTTASTPVNSVQATGGGQDELIPQFVPLNGQSIYEGHLYKFYFFSEFASGCTSAGQQVNFPDPSSSASKISCPCLGGSCSGRYSVDLNKNFVFRANDGTLRAYSYSDLTAFYTANGRAPTPQEAIAKSIATPVWDTAQLMADNATSPWTSRAAYTAIDTSNDGKIDTNDGTNGLYRIAVSGNSVTDAVADDLTPYLGIVGTDVCTSLAAMNVGVTYPDPVLGYRTCAKAVLNYALGKDLFDSNSNGNVTENRLNMLGDVYHSTPIDIGPPVQEQFCDFNSRRCAATLFNVRNQSDTAHYNALNQETTYISDRGVSVSNGDPIDSYEAWVNDQIYGRQMSQVRVFGANDGWIHAIQFSCYTGIDSTNGAATYYGGPGHTGCTGTTHDNGTELWAFIPPDLLPKLAQMALRSHQTFADLTPMVRDVYSGTGITKAKTDFHTVAIFGERNGGTHWTALDVTDPTAPQLRWMYPQIGSADEMHVGLSWGEYFPGSPPIGAVRMDTTLSGSPTWPEKNGTPFHEEWVVMLPGGYDRFVAKGSGFYMLNAWTGEKYWDAWDSPGMVFPFAGFPAMVAWGTKESAPIGVLNNGFFDTAVIADTGGQLWTARFNAVPIRAANGKGDSVATNWFAARAFRQADGDDSGTAPFTMKNRLPFFMMPSVGRMTDSGYMRAFIGSGDRGNVDDQFLGDCTGANMLACGKQGMKTMAERDGAIGSSTLLGAYEAYDGTLNAKLSIGETLTYSPGAASQCTPAGQELSVCLAGLDVNGNAVSAYTPPSPNEPQRICVHTASGEKCSRLKTPDLSVATAFDPTTGKNGSVANVYNPAGNGYYGRFYGATLFKPGSRGLFTDAATAASYDAARITESTSTCPSITGGLCNLYAAGVVKDYSFPESPAKLNRPTNTTGTSDGFFFYYPTIDEKTVSNVLLSSGCLLWSTVQPTSNCTSSNDCVSFSAGTASSTNDNTLCTTAANECIRSTQCNVVGGSSAGHIYQTNAVDGSTNCALVSSDAPRVTFGTILPPPPPQKVTFVSPQGLVQTAVVLPAGLSPTVLPPRPGGGQLLKTFYDLEIPRSMHDCRHGSGPCN